jgi:ubiquinol-cytochrome c reductase cytochrome c1 subunit
MKRILISLSALLLSGAAVAAGGGPLPYSFEPDVTNLPSVQRGARNYMAYCSACHSMNLLRYSRIGEDLGIPEDILKANLMFTSDKPGDTISAAMPAESATWFGRQPPDLTVSSRARGPSWVYSYLMTFYLDPSRPAGVNNLVLAGASMPHVLWELQGWQTKGDDAHHAEDEGHGGGHGPDTGLTLVQEGTLSPEEYEAFVADTVNFMAYAAEPGRAGRVGLGMKVMLFLLVFSTLAYMLKKEFWKDVH